MDSDQPSGRPTSAHPLVPDALTGEEGKKETSKDHHGTNASLDAQLSHLSVSGLSAQELLTACVNVALSRHSDNSGDTDAAVKSLYSRAHAAEYLGLAAEFVSSLFPILPDLDVRSLLGVHDVDDEILSGSFPLSSSFHSLSSLSLTPLPAESHRNQRSGFGTHLKAQYGFARNYLNLNHGSFGAPPKPIAALQTQFRNACDSRPDIFLREQYPLLLLQVRRVLASYLRTDVRSVVLVPNVTMGINAILRGLEFGSADRILYLDTIYETGRTTLDYVCERTGAVAVCVPVPTPQSDSSDSCPAFLSEEWYVSSFEQAIKRIQDEGEGEYVNTGPKSGSGETPAVLDSSCRRRPRVRLAIFETITSIPGLPMPITKLLQICRSTGILSLLDGAHGLGHLPLPLDQLDPDFFVSSIHKWLSAPRSVAMLSVPLRNQHLIRSSLPTGYGHLPKDQWEKGQRAKRPVGVKLSSPELTPDENKLNTVFTDAFIFTGTFDPSAHLCIPGALLYRACSYPGGERAIMGYTSRLARVGGRAMAALLGTELFEPFIQGQKNDEYSWAWPSTPHSPSLCSFAVVRLPLDLYQLAGSNSGQHSGTTTGLESNTAALNSSSALDGLLRVTANQAISWLDRHIQEAGTFIPVFYYRRRVWARVSAQIYLDVADFEWVGRLLAQLCKEYVASHRSDEKK